jgi:hypothetical protein
MSKTYTITHYDKFWLDYRQCDCYSFHRKDNNCEDIKVGDFITTEDGTFRIKMMEEFHKSFGIKGDNVSVTVE